MQEDTNKTLKILVVVVTMVFLILQVKPSIAPFFINKGIESFEKNNFNKSLVYLKTASFLNTREPLIHLKLAQIYQNKRLFHRATQEYKKALKLNPNFSDASIGLAKTHLEIGQYNEAIIVLNKALELSPENLKVQELLELAKYDYVQHQINRAVDAYEQKQREAAREFLKSAAEFKPKYLFNLFAVENILAKSERSTRSISALEKIAKMDPEYRIIYRLLGDTWLENLEFKKAIDSYEKYLPSEPNDVAVRNNLAICYNRLSMLDKSIEQYRIALSLLPDNINIIYGLASSYRQKEMYEEAINLYNHLIKLDAGLPYIYIDLAEIYKKTDKPDEAKKAIAQAKEISSAKLEKDPSDKISKIVLNKIEKFSEEPKTSE